jgi:hypothetical protein
MLQERAALKKLDNVKKDHEKRITDLQKEQVCQAITPLKIKIKINIFSKQKMQRNEAV